jgi:hypothetical protein
MGSVKYKHGSEVGCLWTTLGYELFSVDNQPGYPQFVRVNGLTCGH